MEFKNVAAIVTGGASGLGEGSARAWRQLGAVWRFWMFRRSRVEKWRKTLGASLFTAT